MHVRDSSFGMQYEEMRDKIDQKNKEVAEQYSRYHESRQDERSKSRERKPQTELERLLDVSDDAAVMNQSIEQQPDQIFKRASIGAHDTITRDLKSPDKVSLNASGRKSAQNMPQQSPHFPASPDPMTPLLKEQVADQQVLIAELENEIIQLKQKVTQKSQ